MNEKIIQTLKRPFGKDFIKQRRGAEGKLYDYIEVQNFVDRLNEAFDHDWSFELTKHERIDEQIIVEVRLSAGGLVKTGLGGAIITRRTHDNSIVSLADDVKKAEADALKRACRLMGIGSELYATASEDVNPGAAHSQIPRERLTNAQLNAIKAIAKKHNMDPVNVRREIKKTYGVEVEYLTRRQASEVISTLDSQKVSIGGHVQHARAG